ncbi:hypothetical protein Tco_0150598 [Tanacetum coccineum]
MELCVVKIWPKGSLEEQVQNLVKTWEMEMFHKVNPQDFKAVDVTKLTVSVNGKLKSDRLDEHFKIVKIEFFYNSGELLTGLTKGGGATTAGNSTTDIGSSRCPFS